MARKVLAQAGDDFSGRDLKEVDFAGANLHHCRFVDSDLRGANFTEANLAYSDFTGAKLDGAFFRGANMHQCKGARRNGGPLLSVTGLQYPVVIDGQFIHFGCTDGKVDHTQPLPDRLTLLRMDKRDAVEFEAVGRAILEWYRKRALAQ